MSGGTLSDLAQVARRMPYFAAHHAALDRLATPADLGRLPLSAKDDFRADYTRFVSGEPAVRAHTTSGSTGLPAMVLYSASEIQSITTRARATMQLAGVAPGDRVLNLFGYGTFIAGSLYDWGATALGALVIPFGSATMTPPSFAAEAIRRLEPRVVNGVPSYLLRFLGDLATQAWPELGRIQILQCAGEVLTPVLRERLQAIAPERQIFDQYGMTEFGPLAAECSAHDGMHLLEHGLCLEVVDEHGSPITAGEGELVVSSLENRAMIFLRYRTGDRVLVHDRPCACGRPGRRIQVRHRLDDLTKIRGVLCSKNDLVDVVRGVCGGAPFTIRIHRDDSEVDRVVVRVALSDGDPRRSALPDDVRNALQSRLRIGPDLVELLPSIEVPRTVSGKPRPLVDERAEEAG
ncbi:MAG TPA: AMP-binding protein [Candidatus Udaeobacter sp.]|nr:AMP-binding protein [Candidatus Udaeobacter sp.]